MKRRSPRRGSMQFWHRVRAKRQHPRVHGYPASKEAILLGFAGYKVGMTHAIAIDNNKNKITKGQEISFPLTILECPPLKVASARFYKNTSSGLRAVSDILSDSLDKELARTITFPKQIKNKFEDVADFDEVVLVVYTQPKLTGIGKKKPEVFEVHIGGKKEDKLKYAKEKLGKEIRIDEVFKEGVQLDIHGVTTGKGFQGPVKRFGVRLKSHKSEKGVRAVGSLGGWKAHGHFMYRVAHAGQMGYHKRTELNKWLIKIGKDAKDINPSSGFNRYGIIKNQYILLKGSILGPKKRLIRFSSALRPNRNIPSEAPKITFIGINKLQN